MISSSTSWGLQIICTFQACERCLQHLPHSLWESQLVSVEPADEWLFLHWKICEFMFRWDKYPANKIYWNSQYGMSEFQIRQICNTQQDSRHGRHIWTCVFPSACSNTPCSFPLQCLIRVEGHHGSLEVSHIVYCSRLIIITYFPLTFPGNHSTLPWSLHSPDLGSKDKLAAHTQAAPGSHITQLQQAADNCEEFVVGLLSMGQQVLHTAHKLGHRPDSPGSPIEDPMAGVQQQLRCLVLSLIMRHSLPKGQGLLFRLLNVYELHIESERQDVSINKLTWLCTLALSIFRWVCPELASKDSQECPDPVQGVPLLHICDKVSHASL